ncbi:MAG: co-chaperone YbbN [Methylobacteriaceae bacterium]|nr:co-chaperone YbbN [Methylobacteriaceae bacterium]
MTTVNETNAPSDVIKDTTTNTFMKDVVEESMRQPVIVDFWAPWCNPCKQLSPVLEKLVRASRGKVKLVKLDIERYPEIHPQLRIQSIPAVYAFFRGQPMDGFLGNQPEAKIKAFIDRLISTAGMNGETGDILAQAEELMQAGDVSGAAEIYAAVLAEEPGNLTALAALVKIHVRLKDLEGARRFLDMVPAADKNKPEIAAARAEVELAEQTAALGDAGDLKRRIAEDPKDYQARLDMALIVNAKGKREEAAELLLDIMRKDRAWNDDAARKQLLQFFEAWGAADPATRQGRRKLSSLLFS